MGSNQVHDICKELEARRWVRSGVSAEGRLQLTGVKEGIVRLIDCRLLYKTVRRKE